MILNFNRLFPLNHQVKKYIAYLYDIFEMLPRVDKKRSARSGNEQLPTTWGAVTNPQARNNKKVDARPTFLIMLALTNTFRTYDWLKQYQPIDLTFDIVQQILQQDTLKGVPTYN